MFVPRMLSTYYSKHTDTVQYKYSPWCTYVSKSHILYTVTLALCPADLEWGCMCWRCNVYMKVEGYIICCIIINTEIITIIMKPSLSWVQNCKRAQYYRSRSYTALVRIVLIKFLNYALYMSGRIIIKILIRTINHYPIIRAIYRRGIWNTSPLSAKP